MNSNLGLRSNDARNSMAGWSFTDADIARALSGEAMLNPSMDLSNPCNLNCPYCFIEEKNSSRKLRKPHELTISELFEVIDDFDAAGAETINIVGAGEPTIDPAFREVITKIAEYRMVPVIFTNGIRLANDPALVDLLYSLGATVVLKYNAIDPSIQDLVAGRPGFSRKRNQAFENLLDRGFNAHEPTRLALDVIAFSGNFRELVDIHRMCRDAGILPIIGDFIPTGRTETGHFMGYASMSSLDEPRRERVSALLQPLSPKERQDIYALLARVDHEDYGISRPSEPAYYSGGPCTQLLGVYVDIQGDIWPCVARAQITDALHSEPLGNTRRGDLPSSVWKNHFYMRSLRANYSGRCPYKPPLVQVVTTPVGVKGQAT